MELRRNKEVEDHQMKVAEAQIYDKFEKKYISKEKLRR